MYLFEVAGIPVPQKQTQFVRKTGIAYNPSKKDAEQLQWQIRPYAPETPLSCAIEMHLTFYLPIPKATSRIKRMQMMNGIILPKTKPDVDNLAYLVTNALKKIVYDDDSLVTDCIIRKRYSDRPRTVIKIIPIDELQRVGGQECV
jgi:Holliday junction resolvase RusA-like endonuclease